MKIAADVIQAYAQANRQIITIESCTGGLIGATLTDISGSSAVVEGGFITYANEAKEKYVGVDADLLAKHGAVSEPVARAMAEGGLKAAFQASASVAVTGIAGPNGGTATKPVGLVYIASAFEGKETIVEQHIFAGDRQAVRQQTVEAALKLLRAQLAV